jgi:hypothetical protein
MNTYAMIVGYALMAVGSVFAAFFTAAILIEAVEWGTERIYKNAQLIYWFGAFICYRRKWGPGAIYRLAKAIQLEHGHLCGHISPEQMDALASVFGKPVEAKS